MNIEEGDYFVVTRGWLMGDPNSLFGMPPRKEPHYDRSHDGCIYLALSVCGETVAARRVHGRSNYQEVGEVISLTLRGIEVMTVTEKYVHHVTGQTTAPKPGGAP